LTIPIIHEHSDYLLVNKPAGLSFHKEPPHSGLQQLLQAQCGIKLWPVHRLDKITSGLVIFAKSADSAAKFGKLFEDRQIQKRYLALSDKKPKKKMGKVFGDMAKARSGSWKLLQSKNNPAITEFSSQSLMPGIRLFKVKPITGKTHQIRVALKSLGSAILGDTRYGGKAADRGYLHCYSLRFVWQLKPKYYFCIPDSGEYFTQSTLHQLVNPESFE
jgi:tRNA pseudouridine32 synthase / 23S rRNA pseudouridine746 synthase